jgi:SM-20-related protein
MTTWLDDAVTALAEKGWYRGDMVISPRMVSALNDWIDAKLSSGAFSEAAIGKDQSRQTNERIRGDKTLWIPDESADPVLSGIINFVKDIRLVLNRELFAGLETFEGHLAVYPPGGFYKKHIDTFRVDDARRVTLIFYLNQGWLPDDGGQLRLYTGKESSEDIEPIAGTVLLFMSRDFAHEVLAANKERRSFTGWYKTRSSGS